MNVLAVGAHWDDIEIGCGLSLMRLKSRGAKLFGAVLTSSDYSMDKPQHARAATDAVEEGRSAFDVAQIQPVAISQQPNQCLRYTTAAMKELESVAYDHAIDMVFTHWFGDHNTDHAAAWDLSRVAFRRVPSLLQYASNAYFDNVKIFQPQYFWGFTEAEYEKKRQLIAVHASEWNLRADRWQRELFDRERYWGYLCGHDYAEAFMISRLVDVHA